MYISFIIPLEFFSTSDFPTLKFLNFRKLFAIAPTIMMLSTFLIKLMINAVTVLPAVI